jgi:predicted DCC family thiol-disulfide oxidoreductase YuxK
MNTKASNNPVIFFDGICNLCNASVNFIIRNDKAGNFRFASLQSEFAKAFLENNDSLKNGHILPDSLILAEDGKVYFRSEAALRIAGKMDGIWKALIIFRIIPLRWRDFLYDFIAKNRYQWFGKRQSCMVPSPDISDRFF